MVDFKFDPAEIVRWAGIGDLTLRTAVRRIMSLPPEKRVGILLYRDGDKTPASFDVNRIEQLAALPEFKAVP